MNYFPNTIVSMMLLATGCHTTLIPKNRLKKFNIHTFNLKESKIQLLAMASNLSENPTIF
jgi:hypothetical protein